MYDRDIKGITNELECKREFVRRGYMVSTPICQSCKYDFVADINGKLFRIQVKHSKKSKTGLSLESKSVHLSADGAVVHKYSHEDIDFICTCFNGTCYLIPINEIEGRTHITLSLSNTWVNAHHLMIADDYIIDRQIGKLISGNYNKDQLEYKIQQLTKDNVLVEEHNCVTEFEICREDIKKQAHISECINGKRKSAYGFVWRRVINKAK